MKKCLQSYIRLMGPLGAPITADNIRELGTAQKGQTCVCTQLHWKGHLVKARIALAVGKQTHDKRDVQRDRDWNRQKQRILRENTKK